MPIREVINVTAFEQIGTDMQFGARTKEEAKRLFKRSCTKCCNEGKHIDCYRCAIDNANKIMIEFFERGGVL